MAIQTITTSNFDQTINDSKPVLVDFWAAWCGPCRMLGPIIEQLAGEVGDKAIIGKVNVDEEPQLAARYGISTIPTVLVFQNGEVIQKSIGVRPKEELKTLLGL
ncbi:MAG: thioredoxin [Clostridiales bacterium]|nr:thioredoxin [Clostridiales bacterium]